MMELWQIIWLLIALVVVGFVSFATSWLTVENKRKRATHALLVWALCSIMLVLAAKWLA